MALRAPERVSALVLACTSAAMDPEIWNARATTVRRQGMGAIAETVMTRFFTEAFRKDHPDIVEDVRARFLKVDPSGYANCCAAIRDMALLDRIGAITAPTLVIAGDHDVATPFHGHGDKIQERIAGARAAMTPCGHLAPVELPAPFAIQLKTFLSGERHG